MTNEERIRNIQSIANGTSDDRISDGELNWLCMYALKERKIADELFAKLGTERDVLNDVKEWAQTEIDGLQKELSDFENSTGKLRDAVAFAEDYLSAFEMENDMSKPGLLYIRDAIKCLRDAGEYV